MNFVNNIKTAFTPNADLVQNNERGDLVQTLIITAGFAVASIFVVLLITNAMNGKGADVANCITDSGKFVGNDGSNKCEDNNAKKAGEKNAGVMQSNGGGYTRGGTGTGAGH